MKKILLQLLTLLMFQFGIGQVINYEKHTARDFKIDVPKNWGYFKSGQSGIPMFMIDPNTEIQETTGISPNFNVQRDRLDDTTSFDMMYHSTIKSYKKSYPDGKFIKKDNFGESAWIEFEVTLEGKNVSLMQKIIKDSSIVYSIIFTIPTSHKEKYKSLVEHICNSFSVLEYDNSDYYILDFDIFVDDQLVKRIFQNNISVELLTKEDTIQVFNHGQIEISKSINFSLITSVEIRINKYGENYYKKSDSKPS